MTESDQSKVYHEQQTEDDVLRRMLATPPKPHKPLGKGKTKRAQL